VRSAVQKNVCNDRITALKLKAELVSILLMQAYIPILQYEDDVMEDFYYIRNS
jgi:hypothetical protein